MNMLPKFAALSPSSPARRHCCQHGGLGACHPGCPCAAAGGQFGMAIAHEVSQPLAALALHAAAARKWLSRAEPDVQRALDALALIGAAGHQAGEIVRGLQRQAAGQAPETARVAVDAAVAEALQALRWPMRKQGIAVEACLGLGDAGIVANRAQLQQVVTNLLVNAVEAINAHARPQAPRIRIETLRSGAEIEIAVSDNGPGIAPDRQPQVLASLAGRADNSRGQGSGLGLAISAGIVREHGGRLWFEPCVPHGACFRLRLPAAPPAPASAALASSIEAHTT